jgi:predicted nucleic acid-binding protein
MAQVVIDANIGIALVLNLPYSDLVEQHMAFWRESQVEIVVPSLWWYEVVSSLRKAVIAALLSEQEVLDALEQLSQLGIRVVEASLETHRRALGWAARLKETVAYDAQYLALAEQTGAEFWTADKRLADRAREGNGTWVMWIQEQSSG